MDNIIKIILRQSGGLAEMVKTIPLYVGMYNTAILNVYVPQSLVSEGISVKVGAILTANDGTKATTDSLPMTYKGEETFCNEEYSVYELNPFPANFLTYAGQQDLVVNIVTIENEEVASVVTTQICKVDVLDSALIPDEELEASAVDLLSARITTNEQNIATNTDNITANTGQIAQNTQDISSNTQRISELEQTVSVGENYVGSLTVDTLVGIETKLNQLVQQVESRQPKNGDVVMVTLQIAGQTDEIYKYYYTAGGWGNYQIPSIESASNTDKGIIKGTLGENKNTQVDITGGEINAIYVKDNNNVLRDIREYANTTKTSLDNIISGSTKAGHSVRADQDQNGNEITNTYLTQNAGVTKTQMREYAMPREFNDIYFLGKDGADTIISNEKPSSSLTWSESVSGIGTTELLSATFISNASFELSQKNSYQAVFYASADVNKTCQFRADIKYDNVVISTELSNEFVMVANNVYKVQFNANFNELQDVINYDGTKQLEIVLSVVTTDSGTATFTLYTNNNYISTFNLNTNKYTIATQSGYLGEIVEINSTGTLANGVVTFEIDRTIYNNTLIKFVLSYTGGSTTDEIVVVDADTNEEYHLKTPYNTDAFADRPVVEDFRQTSIAITGGVTTISFVGLSKVIENYGTEIFVNEDNLTEIFTLISSKQNALTQTQLDAVNSGMTSADKTKLDGIQAGAEVNVQADWNQTDTSADDYIKNKPNIPSGVVVDLTLDATSNNAIANSAVTNALNNKMDKANPTGTGSLSINRKANTMVGAYSVAEGYATTASGNGSHAEGNNTTASGDYSHAEGYLNIASGHNSHAEGTSTTASGLRSHAEGFITTASGVNSHAEGIGTIAQRNSQHVMGQYNIADTTGANGTAQGAFIEIVGNGTADNVRSNARTLDWNGNEVLAGTSQATGFKTANGTSSQFLKADGSVDSITGANITNLQNSKVDKTSTANQIYGTDSNGNQTTIEYGSTQTNSANKIVQRDANRDVLVPSTPTSNNSATSKLYVDNHSMLPADFTLYHGQSTDLPLPVVDNIYYTAENNGHAYLRFDAYASGKIGFQILGANNEFVSNIDAMLNIGTQTAFIIPMKQGQKLKCTVLTASISWADVYLNYTQ